MTTPLVSIMTPCRDATRTLPWALASLIAQSYENWECLLIDDASTDDPLEVARRFDDPRIRPTRLSRNLGRGGARQVALEQARGDLLAMLDADDWIYPGKLGRQVDALTSDLRIDLVGAGMAIVDEGNDLVGVRCRGPAGPVRAEGPVRRLGPPPVAFGPAMLRTAAARQAGFDRGLVACEDYDFLIRYLDGRRFASLADVSYVYSEHATTTPVKAIANIRTCRAVLARRRERYPMGSRWQVGKTLAKEAVYRGAFALGMGRRLVSSRSMAPTAAETADFLSAKRIVSEVVASNFPAAVAEVSGAIALE